MDNRPASIKNFLATACEAGHRPHRHLPAPRLTPRSRSRTSSARSPSSCRPATSGTWARPRSAPTLRRAAAVHPISDLQIEYSLISRGIEDEVLPPRASSASGIIIAYGVLTRTDLRALEHRDAATSPTSAHDCPGSAGTTSTATWRWSTRAARGRRRRGATVAQLAIAWVLHQATTSSPSSARAPPRPPSEALAAAELQLSATDPSRSRPQSRLTQPPVPATTPRRWLHSTASADRMDAPGSSPATRSSTPARRSCATTARPRPPSWTSPAHCRSATARSTGTSPEPTWRRGRPTLASIGSAPPRPDRRRTRRRLHATSPLAGHPVHHQAADGHQRPRAVRDVPPAHPAARAVTAAHVDRLAGQLARIVDSGITTGECRALRPGQHRTRPCTQQHASTTLPSTSEWHDPDLRAQLETVCTLLRAASPPPHSNSWTLPTRRPDASRPPARRSATHEGRLVRRFPTTGRGTAHRCDGRATFQPPSSPPAGAVHPASPRQIDHGGALRHTGMDTPRDGG